MKTSSTFLVRDMGAISLGAEWKGDVHRSSRVIKSDKTLNFPIRGRSQLGSPIQSYIAPQILSDNRVLVSLLGDGLQLRNIESGAVIWTYIKPLGVGSKTLVLEPYVYVSNMNSEVAKIRLDSGEILWEQKLNVESTGGFALAHGMLFLNTADNAVWALDEKTGNPIWTYRRPISNSSVYWSLRGSSTPLISFDGGRLFVGFADGSAVALKTQTGDVIWEVVVPTRSALFKDFDLGPISNATGSQIYIAQADGDLLALNPASGAILWRRSLSVVSPMTYLADRDELFVSSYNGDFHAISARDGSVIWTQNNEKSGLATSVVPFQKDKLLVTWTHGPVSMHQAKGGASIWSSKSELRSLASASADETRILILSTRNELHRFVYEPVKD